MLRNRIMRYLLVMKAHGLANEIAKGSVGLQNYLDKLSRRIENIRKRKLVLKNILDRANEKGKRNLKP